MSTIVRNWLSRTFTVAGINPAERVGLGRGPVPLALDQGGDTPILVEVLNEAGATKPLRITNPQSGLIVLTH